MSKSPLVRGERAMQLAFAAAIDSGQGVDSLAGVKLLEDVFATYGSWDWDLFMFNGADLLMIADIDLTYHHSIEVVFHKVSTISSVVREFTMPCIREANELERGQASATETAFAWTCGQGSDLRKCLVVAERVEVLYGDWTHYLP